MGMEGWGVQEAATHHFLSQQIQLTYQPLPAVNSHRVRLISEDNTSKLPPTGGQRQQSGEWTEKLAEQLWHTLIISQHYAVRMNVIDIINKVKDFISFHTFE